MKIGILGGTFDPPHLAHIALAQAAIRSLGLDEVMMLPAHQNPLKKQKPASAKDRLEMLKLAIADEPELSLSDIEIGRGGPSYSVDTLGELTYARPAEYWFICGEDALREIDRWKQPQKLLRMCRLGVALRSTTSREDLLLKLPEYAREKVVWIDLDRNAISGTELRHRIVTGRPVRESMNPKVLQYIEKNRLYRS
jgi:nicotinate-nucleotide adenylyltransferase